MENNEILPIATTLKGLEDIILREISRTERDKYHKGFLKNHKRPSKVSAICKHLINISWLRGSKVHLYLDASSESMLLSC